MSLDKVVALFEHETAFYVRRGPGLPEFSLVLEALDTQQALTTIDQLAATLSTHVNRPVVNRTDLTGLFDIDLRYMPDYTPFIPAGAPPPPTDPNAPPLFTAVQEQLGLKLETARGPVDVLVIDSVEKPSVD